MEQDLTIGQKVRAIKILLLIILVIITFLASFRTVDAGKVKVVTRFGKTTGRVLEPGASFIVPFAEGTKTYNVKKITYETSEEAKQQTSQADYKDFPVHTTTADGQEVTATYTIRFRIDAFKAEWLLNNIGTEGMVVERVVKTDSRAWVRTILRDFQAKDLYSGNIREAQTKVTDTLRPIFEENGLILDEFVLRQPVFDEEYQQIMENKQRQTEQVEVEKQKAFQEVEKKNARITAAEGKAKEQELQRETLSAQVLEKMRLEVEMKKAEALLKSAENGQSVVPHTVLSQDSNLLYSLVE